MDLHDKEFESLLRKFRLREARPLPQMEHTAGRGKRWAGIAAAAALLIAAGISAPAIWQYVMRKPEPPVMPVASGPVDVSEKTAAVPAAPIPPLPQPAGPADVKAETKAETKMDPKPSEPLKQLRVVIPAPPRESEALASPEPVVPAGGSAALSQSDLREAKLRAAQEDPREPGILNSACGLCHSPELAGNAHFETVQEYEVMINRMIAYGASLTEQQSGALADYLFKTYGKAADAQDRGMAAFNSACVQCHDAKVMDDRRGATKAQYRAIVDDMIAKGASVSHEEAESLSDYLFRTYGSPQRN